MNSERAYCRLIAGTVRGPLIFLDTDLRIIVASKAFYDLFRLSPGETKDRLIYEVNEGKFYTPALRTLFWKLMNECDSIEDFELRYRSGGSDEKVLLINSRLVVSGNPTETLIMLSVEDVTGRTEVQPGSVDRGQAVDELRQKTAQLEATINSIPDGYIVYGPDRSILRMNAIAEEILGFTGEKRNSSYEERISQLRVQTPSGEPFPIDRIPSNRAFAGETVRNEIMKVFRDDRHYWLSVSAAPIIADDGRMLGVVMEFADITENRQLEKQLEDERDFVTAMIQTSGALITVIDRNGTITRFNKACEELTGYTAEEVTGHNIFERLILPEERESVTGIANRLFAGESTIEFENHWVTRSGKKRFIRWHNSVLLSDKGEPVYAVATGIDITERKRAEEALQKSEEQFRNERNILRQIVNNLPYSFILFSPDLVIEYANETLLKRFGLKLEQVHGKTGDELFSKEIVDIFMPLLSNVIETGEPFCGEVSYHVRGNLLTNIPNIIPLFNERKEISHVIILSVDITSRKRMEAALMESEARLKRSQEIAHLGSWELDIGTNQLTWSDEIYRIFGLQPQEFGATYEAFLDHVHPDDRSAVDEAYMESLKEGRDSYEIEHRVIRKTTGEIRYVHEKCHHVFNSNGQIIRSTGMVHDITERKKVEIELLRRTGELAEANKELEAFSYSVSHDLRSPLTLVQGYSNLLHENYSDILDETGKSFVDHIKAATDKMATIIDQLLKMARISRVKMNCRETDLSPVANSVVEELRRSEPHRNVIINITDSMPAVADPGFMDITLSNLIGNAWKYTSKKIDARIDIGMMKIKNEKVFFIRDNGAGFDMRFAHKLFIPFERLHRESEFAGTGIGLTIVQKIIQRHGGRIWAESETGKGSVFYFTLRCNGKEE